MERAPIVNPDFRCDGDSEKVRERTVTDRIDCRWVKEVRPRRRRHIARLVLLALAAIGFFPTPFFGKESSDRIPSIAVLLNIKEGVPSVRAAPESLEMETGWKYPCLIEVDNGDDVQHSLSFSVEGRTRLIVPQATVTIGANEKRIFPVLLQTLSPDNHGFRLTVSCDRRTTNVSLGVVAHLRSEGASFGLTEHFELEGAIAMRGGKRPPANESEKRPPKEQKDTLPREKDLSHLTVAPNREIGDLVLADMSVMQDLGCQVYRTDISWAIIEQVRGKYQWERSDWIMQSLRSAKGGGCKLVAQIGYQPQWMPTDFPRTESGLQAYSRWVEAVVSRYADQVDCWEIWNEPMVFWFRAAKGVKAPGPEKERLAREYADMILTVVRTASEIIRKRDPDATILSPGFEDTPPGTETFPTTLHTDLLTGGLLKHVDAFCMHSYPVGFPSRKLPSSSPEGWRAFDRSADSSDMIRILQQYDKTTKLYCTEFGGYRLPRGAAVEQETAAALAILRNGSILSHQGYAGAHYYELYDWDESTLTYLMRWRDRYKTRGYLAYQKLISALAGAVPFKGARVPQSRILGCDYSGLVIKAFRRGPEDILCIWNNDARQRNLRLQMEPLNQPNERCFFQHAAFSETGDFMTDRAWTTENVLKDDLVIAVAPLDFHIFSRVGPRSAFGWIGSVTAR